MVIYVGSTADAIVTHSICSKCIAKIDEQILEADRAKRRIQKTVTGPLDRMKALSAEVDSRTKEADRICRKSIEGLRRARRAVLTEHAQVSSDQSERSHHSDRKRKG
jgi:hypothetical protein